jgi:hypothetical protein
VSFRHNGTPEAQFPRSYLVGNWVKRGNEAAPTAGCTVIDHPHRRCTVLAQKSSWASVDTPMVGLVQLACKPLAYVMISRIDVDARDRDVGSRRMGNVQV